jgi:uncharacterized protein with HEPN domain
MQPESAKLLMDMLRCARRIAALSADKPVDRLTDDDPEREAIYWNFTIIGEAMSKLRRFDLANAERISESHRIVDFRNQVVHGYGLIDHEITARVVEIKLPVLIRELEELLKEAGEP